eukprot:gene2544-2786_t
MLTKVKNTIFNKSAAFHIYALANRARKNSKRDASQSRTLFYYLTRVWSRNKVNPGRSRSGTGTRPKSLKGASRNSSSLQATS